VLVDSLEPSGCAELFANRSGFIERLGVVAAPHAVDERLGEQRPRADRTQQIDRFEFDSSAELSGETGRSGRSGS
jgi:hypothetical protein